MSQLPRWFQPFAAGVAVLVAGILIGGILTVPYRFMKAPEGYDMSRVHYNTKNTTRFAGDSLGEVAARVSQAVFPAAGPETRPDLVLLYDPQNWQTGLLAASLLRPLNAVLLPAVDGIAEEIDRLAPAGSSAAGGASVLLLDGVEAPEGVTGEALDTAGLQALRQAAGTEARHALLVDPADSERALLAAPWAAFSGDPVVFDAADAPPGLPVYALGDFDLEGVEAIEGGSGAEAAVNFAAYEVEEDPFFGWGMNEESLTGYRAYTIANPGDPAMALLSANLNIRGKPGPLLWSEERTLPQVVNDYLWSQRPAFFVTPAEGPFHHFYVLGSTDAVSFPAQGQADYAVEISPYIGMGVGLSGIDVMAAAWVALGIASAAWILFHEVKFLPSQMWVMRLAWPLLALFSGPFGIFLYYLAYSRPVMQVEMGSGKMMMWDRPLWLQGLAATASAVGFGASIMIASGWITTWLGAPLFPMNVPGLYLLGTPMILIMIINYAVAVLVSWLLFQTPMLSMFYGLSYRETLSKALPIVLASMTAAAVAMNPAMWVFMMWEIPMMPNEESILWFGVMFFTGFLAFLLAWPLNYILVRAQRKSGMM